MYKKTLLTFIAGYGINLSLGFISVWILNTFMEKSEYGLYALLMTVISLVVVLGANIPERIILYKLPDFESKLKKNKIKNFLSTWSIILSLFTMVLIAGVFYFRYKEDIFEYSLLALVILIPIDTHKNNIVAWLRSTNQNNQSIIFNNIITPIIKIIALILASLYSSLTGVFIVVFMFAIVLKYSIKIDFKFLWNQSLLKKDDFIYGLKMFFTKLVTIGVDKFAIFVLAFMMTTEQVAEYTVAFKISMLVMIGHQFFAYIFTPRIKQLTASNNYNGMIKEYEKNRLLSVLSAFFVFILILLIGEYVLNFLGEYSNSYSILLLISSFMILNISFGQNGPLLMMLGHADDILRIAIIVLIITIISSYFFVRFYNVVGAAISFGIPILIGNYLSEKALRKRENKKFINSYYYLMQIVFFGSTCAYIVDFLQQKQFILLIIVLSVLILVLSKKDINER